MAARSRTPMKDELAPFNIKKIEGLDSRQSKGSGSFGSVYQVTVNGYPCIAKRLHNILVGQRVSDEERQSIRRRFRDECILLSQLRHPNVVQFIGVHCGESKDDLTLVMEGLYFDLEECLSTHRDIPLPIKLTILLDVSYGLLCLHSQIPALIHRDLKAGNVLLTNDMRAKVADLGVSKILDLHPLSHLTQTVCPGTQGVMPPEALVEKPSYTTQLDNFSFGTLILHVVNHEFPVAYDTDDFQKGKLHIAERRIALNKMGKAHCLYPLVVQCLLDDPQKRPATVQITQALEALCKEHPKQFQDVIRMYEEIKQLKKKIRDVETEKEALSVKLNEEEEKRSKIELSLLAKESDWGEITIEQTAEMERLKRELKAQKQEVQIKMKYLESEQKTRAKLEEICTENESKLVEMQGELELMELDRDDHRERFTKIEGDLASAMKEILVSRGDVVEKLSETNQQKKQVESLKTQVAELTEHKQSLVQKLERAHDKLIKSEADADKMRKELKRAQDRLEKKGYAAEQRAISLEDKIAKLEAKNEELMTLNDHLKDILDKQTARSKERTGAHRFTKRKRSNTDPTPAQQPETQVHHQTHPQEDLAGVTILSEQEPPPSDRRILPLDSPDT